MNKNILHIALPFLLLCYLITGAENTRIAASASGSRMTNSHSHSGESDQSHRLDGRPFWTIHKHMPEKKRFEVPLAAVVHGPDAGQNIPSCYSGPSVPAFIPSTPFTPLRSNRAPPFFLS